MKNLILGLLFCGPALAQTQTYVQTVDIQEFHEVMGHIAADSFFNAPNLPGRITRMTWDFDLAVSGGAWMQNNFQEPRYLRGLFYGATLWENAPFGPRLGSWDHTFESPVLAPGAGELVPFWDVWDLQGSREYSDFPSVLGGILGSNPEIETWQACTPDNSTCTGIWPITSGTQGTYQDVTMSLTGTIEWEFEPTLGGVSTVCPGDGAMELDLVGDWQGDVRAWSNTVGNFSMLFRGSTWAGGFQPGFCLTSGARINESLSNLRMNFVLDPTTVLAGETFVIQAVHRVQGGGVAFSNALLAFPL